MNKILSKSVSAMFEVLKSDEDGVNIQTSKKQGQSSTHFLEKCVEEEEAFDLYTDNDDLDSSTQSFTTHQLEEFYRLTQTVTEKELENCYLDDVSLDDHLNTNLDKNLDAQHHLNKDLPIKEKEKELKENFIGKSLFKCEVVDKKNFIKRDNQLELGHQLVVEEHGKGVISDIIEQRKKETLDNVIEQKKNDFIDVELERLYKMDISFKEAINYLRSSYQEFLSDKLYNFVKMAVIPGGILSASAPRNAIRKRVILTKLQYRQFFYFWIDQIFQKIILQKQTVVLVPAVTVILNLLELLYVKDFIEAGNFINGLEFEIVLSKRYDPIFLKMVNIEIFWISTVQDPHYYSASELKAIFANRGWCFIFGLVLTQKGFKSVLDCIYLEEGGELILLLKHKKKI